MKIKVVKKPAQRARKNVPNPFRPGETMDVTAKPASASVKVLPLKKLKDMAQASGGRLRHRAGLVGAVALGAGSHRGGTPGRPPRGSSSVENP